MPSKKYIEYSKKGGLPVGMPGVPDVLPGAGGIPTLPDGYTPPEPVIPAGFEGGKVIMGGVPCLHLKKTGLREKSCFLHIHGGGFTIGSAMECTDILKVFAEDTNLEGYSVEYRLAPQHKFPAAVEDCVCAYIGLLDMGYENIVVGGESAGGGLTLSLALALKGRGIKLPSALWCSSPAVDIMSDKKEVWMRDMFTESGEPLRAAYAPGEDPENPLLSPIYGDLSGLPPILIQTGGAESIAAGAVRFAAKAAAADVEVILHYAKGMEHTYSMLHGLFPEATNGMKEITTFVNNILDLDKY